MRSGELHPFPRSAWPNHAGLLFTAFRRCASIEAAHQVEGQLHDDVSISSSMHRHTYLLLREREVKGARTCTPSIKCGVTLRAIAMDHRTSRSRNAVRPPESVCATSSVGDALALGAD